MPTQSDSPSVPASAPKAIAWTLIVFSLVLAAGLTAAMFAFFAPTSGNPYLVALCYGIPVTTVGASAVGGYILGRVVPTSGPSSVGGERR